MHVEKKDQLCSLNISKVSDSEKCGYLNAQKLVFQNTIGESTCSGILNTADRTIEPLLSELSIDATHIEFEKMSVNDI